MHYRIDDEHSKAFAAWKKMGAPKEPSAQQYAELVKASELSRRGEGEDLLLKSGEATMRLSLHRQRVFMLVFSW
jgi:xylan 1,4-beta-xylosidase